jgi:hypothetical protein
MEILIREVFELPDDTQEELVKSLVEMRAEHLGIYEVDDEERAALARSADDVCQGPLRVRCEIGRIFAHYRGA